MIRSIQKVIRVGSSNAVTLPAKEMKRTNIKLGDEVEIIVRPLDSSSKDTDVIAAARKILADYRQDFQNLAQR